jgi:hypothetical protein
MPIRASLPFQVKAGATVTIADKFDGETRQPVTRYALPVSSETRALAMVNGVAMAETASGDVIITPIAPMSLTADLPEIALIFLSRIVYSGLPIDEVKQKIILKADGSKRRYVQSNPYARGEANADDWASGQYGVYVERGATIWAGRDGGASPLNLSLSLVLLEGEKKYFFDAHDLLLRLVRAKLLAPSPEPPEGLFTSAPSRTIEVIGPNLEPPPNPPFIEHVKCDATGVNLWAPPINAMETTPPGLFYLSPAGGAASFFLDASTLSADWSAVVTDPPGASLVGDIIPSGFRIPKVEWNSLPPPLNEKEVLNCEVNAIASGSTLTIKLKALQHPPTPDIGKASRLSVPKEGSPRAAVGVNELTTITEFVAGPSLSVKLGAVAASDPKVSPDGRKLFFTPAAGAGIVDITIINGDGSTETLPRGLTYTEDVAAGFEGLKSGLAVAAQEAALAAADTSSSLNTFVEELAPAIDVYQEKLLTIQDRLNTVEDEAAWREHMAGRAQFVMDTVNRAVGTMLNNPPIASLDGQPFAGSDEEPEVDTGARVILMTALENVIVSSAVRL